jgi:hypothetical protein
MPGTIVTPRKPRQHDNQTCSAPGFDKLFGQERLSDLTVQISEEPRSEQETIVLPAHKVILYVHSPCFEAKVSNPSPVALHPPDRQDSPAGGLQASTAEQRPNDQS